MILVQSTPAANQDETTQPPPSDCDQRSCGWTMGFPVCDNMGVTHNSLCLFEIEQCKNPQLKLVSQLPCGMIFISNDNIG